jgi:hypothetical protein
MLDELDDKLKKLQNNYMEKAFVIGYIRKTTSYTRRVISARSALSGTTYPVEEVFGSAGSLLDSMVTEVKQMNASVKKDNESISSLVFSAESAYFAADSLVGLIPGFKTEERKPERPEVKFVWFEEDKEGAEENYNRLDKELGKEYKQLMQIEYGTNAEPIRPMMYLARQLFDHTIALLAPDSDIGTYFKLTDEKAKITRRQRLQFIMNVKIKNQAKAQTLLNEVEVIIDTYELLNAAHTRGELNKEKSSNAVKIMLHFLERLINEIEI